MRWIHSRRKAGLGESGTWTPTHRVAGIGKAGVFPSLARGGGDIKTKGFFGLSAGRRTLRLIGSRAPAGGHANETHHGTTFRGHPVHAGEAYSHPWSGTAKAMNCTCMNARMLVHG